MIFNDIEVNEEDSKYAFTITHYGSETTTTSHNLLNYLKEDHKTTKVSFITPASDPTSPFLELLEVIDVPSTLPENGDLLLSDLLDIADCVLVNLDCIDADIS